MSHIFPRHTKGTLPTIERGEGVYLFDTTGKKYLDGSGGAAVSCLGHNDPDVIDCHQGPARCDPLRPYRLFHLQARRSAGRQADRPRP